MQQVPRGQLNDIVVELAEKDQEFRKRLIANPRETLASVLERPLPESVTVTVLEETPGTVHLILPAEASALEELPAAELAQVTGGVLTASAPRLPALSFIVRRDFCSATPMPLPQPDVRQLTKG